MAEKKSRILYIKRFLEEQTDEEHPTTIVDIINFLAGEGISANRKTVAQDIELLIEAGTDVICNRSRQNKYFIGERHFEDPELKMLIDIVQAIKILTATHTKALIKKLLSLASRHQAADLTGSLYIGERIKQKYELSYSATDILYKAIRAQKRVNFKYYEYGPDKKKTYKHNRRVYEFSPWCFIWNGDCYYIIGYSESHGKPVKFRVDRIASPNPLRKDAVPPPEGLNINSYVQNEFRMLDGPRADITLRCENALMKAIIDHFGENVETEIADAEHFNVMVNVAASRTFYGWVFASDGAIEIISPPEIAGEYDTMLSRAKTVRQEIHCK